MPPNQLLRPARPGLPNFQQGNSYCCPSFDQAKMRNLKEMNDTRLLIINDNGELRSNVADYLEAQNICIGSLEPLEGSLVKIKAFAPGLVLLCHSLLSADGFSLLKQIRACSDVPVIMVVATGTDEADRIVGLELGADDCSITPFSGRELVARIRAVLRRNMIRGDEPRWDPALIVYRFAGWQLAAHPEQLIDPSGSRIRLSRVEYALLTAFLRAPGRTLTREYLLSVTYTSADVFDRTIDLGIYKLRRKFGDDAFASSIIATERGYGYRFCASVERVAFRSMPDRQNKRNAQRR
jgi:two-component system, OmpR family, response regulator